MSNDGFILKVLEAAYEVYEDNPTFLLEGKVLKRISKLVDRGNLSKNLAQFLDHCEAENKKVISKRLEIIDEAEKGRKIQEQLKEEAEQKNAKLETTLAELKEQEIELQEKTLVIQESKNKIESQKADLEKQLDAEKEYSLQLNKTEGLFKISVRIVWIMGFLCMIPAFLYLMEPSEKLLDIFENIVILALGTFSGALLGYAGAKNIQTSEGRTQVTATYDYDA